MKIKNACTPNLMLWRKRSVSHSFSMKPFLLPFLPVVQLQQSLMQSVMTLNTDLLSPAQLFAHCNPHHAAASKRISVTPNPTRLNASKVAGYGDYVRPPPYNRHTTPLAFFTALDLVWTQSRHCLEKRLNILSLTLLGVNIFKIFT